MENIRVPNRIFLGPVGIAIAVLGIQSGSVLTSLTAGLMIALAVMIHMAAMVMRDAEFRALTTDHGLNAKDCFAYCCMVLYDAILLFGLVTGAGLLFPWDTFLVMAGLMCVIMPCVFFFVLRRDYDPTTARQDDGMGHWAPPLYLAVLGFAFWGFGTLQTPYDAQPYIWLVFFSANLASTRRAVTFEIKVQRIRYALFAGLGVLLVWNYLGAG
jgi:hypothetical protein